jgi:SAM-dependent methyltransferase
MPAPNPPWPSFRPDFRRQQRIFGDDRPASRVLAHYVLERELSDRLRAAAREARSEVYGEVYHALFAALPDHPQHRVHAARRKRADAELRRIAGRLPPCSVFLEIGCGDAALGFAVARQADRAYGLDVTDALIDFAAAPPNFGFLRTRGVDIPLPACAVDFAYSNQLMEHLHPEDAVDQLMEVHRVLKPGGGYMCITPSRVTGPHDISCYFDYEATGLHLREYDYGALRALFRQAGFRTFSCAASIRGHEIGLPYTLMRAAECGLLALPPRIRTALTGFGPVGAILGLTVIAAK